MATTMYGCGEPCRKFLVRSILIAVGEWLGNSVAVWICFVVAMFRHHHNTNTRSTETLTFSQTLQQRWSRVLEFAIIVGGMSLLGIAALQSHDHEKWSALFTPVGLATGLLLSLQPVTFATAFTSLVLIVTVQLIARDHRQLLFLTLMWTVAFLAPLVVSGGPIHRYYVPQAGYVMLYAFGASIGLGRFHRRFHQPQTR